MGKWQEEKKEALEDMPGMKKKEVGCTLVA
jgi:hypothetical protein